MDQMLINRCCCCALLGSTLPWPFHMPVPKQYPFSIKLVSISLASQDQRKIMVSQLTNSCDQHLYTPLHIQEFFPYMVKHQEGKVAYKLVHS